MSLEEIEGEEMPVGNFLEEGELPDLEVGDVVRLCSGGDLMTVTEVSENSDRVVCGWFPVNSSFYLLESQPRSVTYGSYQERSFNSQSLILIKE